MRSLLAALVAGLLLSLAAVFAVQRSLTGAALETVMRDYIAGELAQDADELWGGLTVVPDGGPQLAITHFDPVFLSRSSGRYFQIMVAGKPLLRSPSLGGDTLAVAPLAAGERQLATVPGPQGQALLQSSSGYQFQGRAVTIAIASDLRPLEQAFGALMQRYTRVSLAMFALLVVLQVGIVRWALAPLRRVQVDVGRLERGEIEQLGERVPAEVRPLVREVNRLLALLTQRLKRSREALGNLAHALKTPLSVLTHMADDERVRHDPQLGPKLAAQVQLLRQRIDSELRRARVAGGRSTGAALDLGAELAALCATLRKLYRERGLDIRCEVAPGLQFHGDREDLLELCGNLLDNACQWAHRRVLLSGRGGAPLQLTVEDDGPGCAEADLARLAQRGVRLDESVAGSGLGLAIAAGIVASYGGTLRFGRSPALGGFQASVSLPPPSA
ncbi:sensor histidine kinase [Pseudoduganella sp. OTU4001]|uniref:sensor histidine kinase n=1 Tax=Pseudoduganella sp. OTU4001 TaxID=3043854 RepID=UPI00313E98A1